MSHRRSPAALGALLCLGTQAFAHSTSTGLLRLNVDGDLVAYRLTLVLAELPDPPRRLLWTAAGGDAASAEQVAEELRKRVLLRDAEAPCRPGRATVQGSRLGDSRVELELSLRCPKAPRELWIKDDWAALLGDHHRTLLRIDGPGGPREIAFAQGSPEVRIDLAGGAGPRRAGFSRLGRRSLVALLALALAGVWAVWLMRRGRDP